MPTRERKEKYFAEMTALLDEYATIIIVTCDNVGSNQFQKIRAGLRGKAVVLMGKNTLMRKVVSKYVEDHPDSKFGALLPYLTGNIGLIFTNGDVSAISKIIAQNKVGAPARVGGIAECDVIIPPGPTGCDPGQTSWFQALNVPTKIQKGQIEIVSAQKILTKGAKVGPSEVALLQKLNIKPFTYGLVLQSVYDNGAVFEAAVLEISTQDLKNKFMNANRRIAAVSLAIGQPTLSSLPHSVGNKVRELLAVSAITKYSFSYSKKWDSLFNMDPAALAALAAAAPAAAGGAPASGSAPAAAPKVEEKEEEVDVGGADLFGGGGAKDGY